jgi:3-oxoacid CoA-transferase subunit A
MENNDSKVQEVISINKQYHHIYLTGDKHGFFGRLLIKAYDITKDDLLIILGDVGVNYYGGLKDSINKEDLSQLPCDILCIHGNHEMRPTSMKVRDLYTKVQWMGDEAYIEPAFPTLIFAEEGARYTINGREFLVVGGAYSVDKYYRLQNGYQWFADEQLNGWEKKHIKEKVAEHGNREDIILAHTCPYNYQPTECFLPSIDQSTVDKSMENFLQELVDTTEYNRLYCGHWHTDKNAGKVQFLYDDILRLDG